MRQVERRWVIRPRGSRVYVSTVHPQFGSMPRGTIRLVGSEVDGRCRWQTTDFDHEDLGELVGNYVDAEAALFAATAALDEVVPAELLSRTEELPTTANLGGSDD